MSGGRASEPPASSLPESTRGAQAEAVNGEKYRELQYNSSMPLKRGSYSNCLTCKAQIWRMPAEIRKGHKIFCGQECRSAALKGKAFYTGPRPFGAENPAWKGGPVTITCKHCGSQYQRRPAAAAVSTYCSWACKKAGQSSRRECQCLACGKKLIRRPSEIAGEVFCNKKCRGVVIGERQRGDANPVWRGGVTSQNLLIRGSALMEAWRKAVFERDGYECQHCGLKNKKGLGHTVHLHAHHIKGFHAYPELRFEVSNGLTLCAPCHHRVHRKVA